jgi:hypothetical protein
MAKCSSKWKSEKMTTPHFAGENAAKTGLLSV